jgi:AraC-like DNA-binding protein
MKDPYGLRKPSVPVSYLQLLLEIVAERGVTQDQLLGDIPFDPALLSRPEARMSPVQWTMLASSALRLTRDPGLGYEYGLRMRPSSHGFLGYATLSCASLRETLEITMRYFQARQRDFTMHFETRGEHVVIEVREKHPIPVLRSFFYENILIGLARGAAACVGANLTQLPGGEIWFDWPEPDYHAGYREKLPTVRFSRAANVLCFPAQLLALRPVLADPHASKQAIALCERELAEIGGSQDDIGLRVCAELVLLAGGGYPDLATVAARLHMSGRSLARKLRARGTSYQGLLEEARRRDAHALIERGVLDMQTVAARLGYRNPANFTRAFRKWTGESPSRYRARLAAIIRGE